MTGPSVVRTVRAARACNNILQAGKATSPLALGGCMRKIVKTRFSGAHSAEGGKPNGIPTPNGDYAFFSQRIFQRNSS
jgi:hypothetical protein